MLNLESKLKINHDLIMAPNLCDRFSGDDLDRIGMRVWEGYQRDKFSRSAWERRMNAAMDLAMQVQVAKTFPWPGCSNVIFPLVTIAALQFSARSYSNIIQGTNVVRYRVIGKEEETVRQRALRIGKHMSWQVLEEDLGWEEQHDRLLINLSIVGTNFIKSRYDPGLGHPVDELVMARDLVLDYWAKSIESAARVTQCIPLFRNEIYERALRKTFRDVRDDQWFSQPPPLRQEPQQIQADLRAGVMANQSDEDAAYKTLEQHRWFDFDRDGYAEPYIVTIEEQSKKVLRIVARFDEPDVEHTASGREILRITPTQYFTKYSFIPSPDGGAYDLGFGVFLGPINEAVNSGIDQLLDNGTMQNSIGGFLGRGAKIRGGVYTMAPWEWKRVDSTGDDLRKNIVPFPERAPSEVMFKLIGLLIEYANRIAGTVDTMVGENPGQNTPASTFQGMTEQGMQVYGMIFKRVWRAMKEEFKKRYVLNGKFLKTHQDFGPASDFIRREDYTGSPDQIAPVANPRVTSTVMRINQAALVKQSAMQTPGYSLPEVEKEWLMALEVEGIDRLYPGPDKVPPLPNPKAAIEQMKLEGKKMEIQARQQEWANHLMEERRLNNAKIAQLEAQAFKLMEEAKATKNEAEVEQIGAKLKALDALIQAHKEYSDMVNDRIKATLGGSDEDSKRGGVSGVAEPSGDQGVQGVPGAVAAGANGAMGGQAVSR
jgi:chaperonin GroES